MNQKDNKYAIAVVAAMSAGKSTLLNAMIGERLLPSRNEACTAKVFSLEDDDSCKRFEARCVTKGVPGEWLPASGEQLSEWNGSKADRIEIRGNLEQIHNMKRGRAVLFFDTPGPNNSRDESHAEVTKQIIANSTFCALICVLNAAALGTLDEFKLLSFIRSQIQTKGASRTNVIFVLNKIDEFDISAGTDDSILESLKICRKFLRNDVGFSAAVILPTSGRLALNIRLLLRDMRKMTAEEAQAYAGKCKTGTELYAAADSMSRLKQMKLGAEIDFYLAHRKDYADAMQFSATPKRIWLAKSKAAKAVRAVDARVLLNDKLYRMQDIRLVERLTGIPILETYLENKLKTFSGSRKGE